MINDSKAIMTASVQTCSAIIPAQAMDTVAWTARREMLHLATQENPSPWPLTQMNQ